MRFQSTVATSKSPDAPSRGGTSRHAGQFRLILSRFFYSWGLFMDHSCRVRVAALSNHTYHHAPSRRWFKAMTVRLTRNEIQLSKELAAAGEHGRIVGLAPISNAEVAHLLDLHYIKRIHGTKLFAITARGRQALAETTSGQR
jgi:hypothetical protein